MTKKEVKALLAKQDFKMIPPSWFKVKTSVIFTAYDEYGICWHFFIDFKRRWASREMMSYIATKSKEINATWMFYGEEVKK